MAPSATLGRCPPYTCRRLVSRKVDRLSCGRFGSARYSVPTRLIDATVGLSRRCGRLQVVEPATSEIVADHGLVAPGETSVLDVSARSARSRRHSSPAPPRPAHPARPELDELSALEAAHGRDALIGALEQAVAFGRWRAVDVRSILAASIGVA